MDTVAGGMVVALEDTLAPARDVIMLWGFALLSRPWHAVPVAGAEVWLVGYVWRGRGKVSALAA